MWNEGLEGSGKGPAQIYSCYSFHIYVYTAEPGLPWRVRVMEGENIVTELKASGWVCHGLTNSYQDPFNEAKIGKWMVQVHKTNMYYYPENKFARFL